jgi:hypothetical protein
MQIKEKIAIGTVITLSLACMLLALAPFTPAVFLSLLLLLVAGFIGYKGFIQLALIVLLINTLAVIGSPAIDASVVNTSVMVFLIFLVSFSGVLLGVRRGNAFTG